MSLAIAPFHPVFQGLTLIFRKSMFQSAIKLSSLSRLSDYSASFALNIICDMLFTPSNPTTAFPAILRSYGNSVGRNATVEVWGPAFYRKYRWSHPTLAPQGEVRPKQCPDCGCLLSVTAFYEDHRFSGWLCESSANPLYGPNNACGYTKLTIDPRWQEIKGVPSWLEYV